MNKLPLVGLLVIAAGLASAQQPAKTALDAEVDKAISHASIELDDEDYTQNIQDQMKAYLEKSGLGARQDKHEIEILTSISTVQVPSTSHDWVMQRSAAYDDALVNAEAGYIKQQGLQITDETTSRLYKAVGQEPPPYDSGRAPGQSAELIRKIVALANGQLDGELRNLGIDPKDYAAAPPPQRYVQLQSALKRQIARHAIGELSGLLTVQTFEGQDGKGNYAIGVVAVISQASKEFAREVVTAHGVFTPDPDRAQNLTSLYSDRPQLVRDFGVRRLFDAAGLPVLVSFAQTASSYAGSDAAVAGEYRRVALDEAEAKADGQIAQFLKGSMMFDSLSTNDREMQKDAERLPDGYGQDDAATKTATDGLLTTLRNRAQVSITGIKTLYSWSGKHPETGQRIVGVIRIWSSAGESATRGLRDRHGPASPGASAAQPHGSPTVTKGRDLMNTSDF